MDSKTIITYFVGFLPFVIYSMKVFIDNWKSTELEKILMSNFRKFQIALIRYVLTGLAYAVLIYMILLVNAPKEWMAKGTLFWLVIFISFTVLSIVVLFIIEKTFMFLINLLEFKYDYYIVDDIGNRDSLVIKLSDKNHLLVENNGIEKFIVNPKERKYKRVLKENALLNKFYNSKISTYISWGCIVLTIILFIYIFRTEGVKQIIVSMFTLFMFFLSLILLSNTLNERKNREKK